MLWCLVRYGARPIDYVRFEFHKKSGEERDKYLTIFRYFKMLKKFGCGTQAVSGKINEYKTYGHYIHRDWMVAEAKTTKDEILNFVNSHDVVFAKPNHGDQGHGVLKIHSGDSERIDKLCELLKTQSFVVESAIENEANIKRLNPSSLNTVRAYTLIKRNGSTDILSIMLRVGKEGVHVDNWGSGGVGYNFDLDTGICVDYGRDKNNRPYVFHPGSNAKMIGYQLPEFEKLKSFIVELSQKVPEARFVGWDIAITPDGYELVEMNCPGGHDFLQVFGKPFGDILKQELEEKE